MCFVLNIKTRIFKKKNSYFYVAIISFIIYNNTIRETYLHQAIRHTVNYLVSNNIDT